MRIILGKEDKAVFLKECFQVLALVVLIMRGREDDMDGGTSQSLRHHKRVPMSPVRAKPQLNHKLSRVFSSKSPKMNQYNRRASFKPNLHSLGRNGIRSIFL